MYRLWISHAKQPNASVLTIVLFRALPYRWLLLGVRSGIHSRLYGVCGVIQTCIVYPTRVAIIIILIFVFHRDWNGCNGRKGMFPSCVFEAVQQRILIRMLGQARLFRPRRRECQRSFVRWRSWL